MKRLSVIKKTMVHSGLFPKAFANQPPVSVMGINVLDTLNGGAYLIGSFSGLFAWHPDHPEIYDFAKGEMYVANHSDRPIGEFAVTGLIKDVRGRLFIVEYGKGLIPLYHERIFPSMPTTILQESKMSLWNVSLEIHTGRFFRFLLNDFYILLVPLSGLVSIIVVLSGYLLWRNKYRKPKKSA